MWKACVAVWDWAGRVDDYRGRLGVIVAGIVLIAGGVLLLLRALGIVNTLLAIVGVVAIVVGGFFLSAYLAHLHAGVPDSAPPIAAVVTDTDTAEPPERPSLEEVGALGERCAKTSKAIYTFLNKHAMRTAEAKVVAEYRQRFDARVINLCADLVAGGLSTYERLKNAAKPVESVDDIQWVARILALSGEGFSASRLAKEQAQAMGELTKERFPHKFPCVARPHVESVKTERPDGTEIETMRCQECGAETHRLLMPPELGAFLDWYQESGGGPALPTLERWMDQERILESQRPRLRHRTEIWFRVLDEEGPFPSSAEGSAA